MAVSCWNIRKTEKEYRETSDKQTYHKHTTINIIYSITNYVNNRLLVQLFYFAFLRLDYKLD